MILIIEDEESIQNIIKAGGLLKSLKEAENK